ncbi:MAG: cupin fold metalloprotein, WbuC family [Rhodospirillaceae bacterium]|nr:cupin fold metalloprotein, WbuC family [Rhodospirillaceae bacterium]MBT5374949.1 cupin fold metalloprotein, WbuC family [Rhodospirillaceae bacterium]MBT5659728.1 cupin fold metalloprotein, WbuC family [Rhodospirillaceae bacterium]MBT5753186.1 cupin fold metalloprotein, WbuC family [Rhodospirillaceae bacterium]
MHQFREENEEVLYVVPELVFVGAEDIAFLKDRAKHTPRRRCRVCAHPNPESDLHEMIIALDQDSYVRPHKHLGKSESLHVIEGKATLFIFSDDGEIREMVHLGDINSGDRFYYRMPKNLFHALAVDSESFVFHEVTKGPLDRNMSVYGDWAPSEEDVSQAKGYLRSLKSYASKHCG